VVVDPPPRFIRDSLYNEDVEGAHPAVPDFSHPPRDIMRLDDVSGTRPRQRIRELKRGNDSMDVRDINTGGTHKWTRIIDPLDPVYFYNGEHHRSDGFGKVRRPLAPHVGHNRILDVTDIEGTETDARIKRYHAFRQPPPPDPEDDTAPADILMVPSMAKQTKELEMQRAIMKYRGDKIRAYEGRSMHNEKGTGDAIQAMLRQQRELRGPSRHETFD
jgi:hypothetical protein